MIAIKDMEMPICCGDCPCFHESSAYTCGATGELIQDAWAWKCRSEACPLEEVEVDGLILNAATEKVERCGNCKYYNRDSQGVRYCRKRSRYGWEPDDSCRYWEQKKTLRTLGLAKYVGKR